MTQDTAFAVHEECAISILFQTDFAVCREEDDAEATSQGVTRVPTRRNCRNIPGRSPGAGGLVPAEKEGLCPPRHSGRDGYAC